MERQYEEGLTAGELGRMIVKRLWIVILAAIAVAALLTAAFAFVINPLGRDYSMEFYLTYPGSDTLKYPDGSSFSYRELISPEALASVKASDERFGSIDTVAMVEKDDISITAEYAAVGGEYMLTGNYTIAVAGKYFSSRDTAQAFIRGIARQAVENVMEKASAIDYSIDEGVFSEASFEDKLSLLEGERESILTAYDEWIEEYRASYSVGGKSLSAYRAEAAVSCGAGELRSLREELESCGYVSLEEMDVRLEELEREYKPQRGEDRGAPRDARLPPRRQRLGHFGGRLRRADDRRARRAQRADQERDERPQRDRHHRLRGQGAEDVCFHADGGGEL